MSLTRETAWQGFKESIDYHSNEIFTSVTHCTRLIM